MKPLIAETVDVAVRPLKGAAAQFQAKIKQFHIDDEQRLSDDEDDVLDDASNFGDGGLVMDMASDRGRPPPNANDDIVAQLSSLLANYKDGSQNPPANGDIHKEAGRQNSASHNFGAHWDELVHTPFQVRPVFSFHRDTHVCGWR